MADLELTEDNISRLFGHDIEIKDGEFVIARTAFNIVLTDRLITTLSHFESNGLMTVDYSWLKDQPTRRQVKDLYNKTQLQVRFHMCCISAYERSMFNFKRHPGIRSIKPGATWVERVRPFTGYNYDGDDTPFKVSEMNEILRKHNGTVFTFDNVKPKSPTREDYE